MDPELKAKWVEALRSGNYQQGRYSLKKDGKYCCLGVLCEVAGVTASGDGGLYVIHGRVWTTTIPYGAFGLTDTQISNLTDLNDSQGPSNPFPDIANFIEKNL